MNSLSAIADRLGIFASMTCALHCLLFPVLLVAGTALPATLLDEEVFHQLIIVMVLPAALVAFGMGCSRHKDLRVAALGSLGVIGIIGVVFLHDALGENGERVLTVISSALLVTAHLRNYRLCREVSCDDKCCDDNIELLND